MRMLEENERDIVVVLCLGCMAAVGLSYFTGLCWMSVGKWSCGYKCSSGAAIGMGALRLLVNDAHCCAPSVSAAI